ncbi:unnamed protein product, partial [Prorocentrum cordatum]
PASAGARSQRGERHPSSGAPPPLGVPWRRATAAPHRASGAAPMPWRERRDRGRAGSAPGPRRGGGGRGRRARGAGAACREGADAQVPGREGVAGRRQDDWEPVRERRVRDRDREDAEGKTGRLDRFPIRAGLYRRGRPLVCDHRSG